MQGDLYGEMGQLNNEVVALNRELARKNAEVERLHAHVSRQAQQLTEADRHKDEFLALLGHELRNPLAPLRNALALLGPEDPDPETVRWARDIMGRQVRLMVRLVDDLLDLSRIMQGKLDLRTERCDLAAVVADAVETARPVIDAKGHELSVSLPAGPVSLDADPTRLAQVLDQPPDQRRQIHRAGWADRPVRPAGRVRGVVIGCGITGWGSPRDAPPDLRSVHAGGRSRPVAGRAGGRADAGEEPRGDARRYRPARSEGLGRGSEFIVRLPAPAATAPTGPQGSGSAPVRR